MGMIAMVVVAVGGFIAAVFAKILADEFKAWRPTFVGCIIRLAVRRLPEGEQERYHEEWLAHVDEIPGDLGKVVVACGFVKASISMSSPHILQFAAKRALDIFVAGFALVTLIPFFIIIAFLIKYQSPGPIFYTHERLGKGRKLIRLYKFRSARSATHEADANSNSLDADPQATPVGNFLRRTNLDELPQLFNIVKGDLSLVGPRALRCDFSVNGKPYDELIENGHYRHTVRPGLTTAPKALDLSAHVTFEQRMRNSLEHDVNYVRNYSFMNDVRIILDQLMLEHGYMLRKSR